MRSRPARALPRQARTRATIIKRLLLAVAVAVTVTGTAGCSIRIGNAPDDDPGRIASPAVLTNLDTQHLVIDLINPRSFTVKVTLANEGKARVDLNGVFVDGQEALPDDAPLKGFMPTPSRTTTDRSFTAPQPLTEDSAVVIVIDTCSDGTLELPVTVN